MIDAKPVMDILRTVDAYGDADIVAHQHVDDRFVQQRAVGLDMDAAGVWQGIS